MSTLALSETTATAFANDNIETVRRQPVMGEHGSPKGSSYKTDEAKSEVHLVKS